ncbi:MAG TPA: K(+)-transporting ATPase subunit F [Steroidobacteraceae bacterium]|nr:K(+)-transporting ATPase subunit F [Steroidobacteraceae bacterium]
MNAIDVVSLVLVIALGVYLVIALLNPEKFQ